MVDDYSRLPTAAHRHTLVSSGEGYVTAIDAMGIARAAMVLGAGRDRVDATIDPAVGVVLAADRGDAVRAGAPLAELHYNDHRRLFEAIALAGEAIVLGPEPPPAAPIVLAEIR